MLLVGSMSHPRTLLYHLLKNLWTNSPMKMTHKFSDFTPMLILPMKKKLLENLWTLLLKGNPEEEELKDWPDPKKLLKLWLKKSKAKCLLLSLLKNLKKMQTHYKYSGTKKYFSLIDLSLSWKKVLLTLSRPLKALLLWASNLKACLILSYLKEYPKCGKKLPTLHLNHLLAGLKISRKESSFSNQ